MAGGACWNGKAVHCNLLRGPQIDRHDPTCAQQGEWNLQTMASRLKTDLTSVAAIRPIPASGIKMFQY